jgi:hypothetical protein
VTLQRPCPVSKSLRPKAGIFSNSTTFEPALAAVAAAIIPAGPPPITTIFFTEGLGIIVYLTAITANSFKHYMIPNFTCSCNIFIKKNSPGQTIDPG